MEPDDIAPGIVVFHRANPGRLGVNRGATVCMSELIDQLRAKRLAAYKELPEDIHEHHGIEQTVLAGGYGYRQVLELVQNGADAILEAHEDGLPLANGNRIHVVLRDSTLYVANTGASLSADGVRSLLRSHSSPKRGNQIGRFGLGFKSLLRLGGKIDLVTQASGSIRFDPECCRRELMDTFNVPEAPGLRLAWPLEEAERDGDPVLREFSWAETIVRAEIRAADLLEHLRQEIRAFPSEFVLFQSVPVVLQLNDGVEPERELRVEVDGDERVLVAGGEKSRWRVEKRDVRITAPLAIADACERRRGSSPKHCRSFAHPMTPVVCWMRSRARWNARMMTRPRSCRKSGRLWRMQT